MLVTERLARLRELMVERKIDAYVVPSGDPHQSEYVADTWQRRAFISGFDGSAGTVVVTANEAGLWTDSRYFLQADEQLAGTGIDLHKMGEPGVLDVEPWLCKKLPANAKVGIDPSVFSVDGYRNLERILMKEYIATHPVPADLVEQVWGQDRPPMPLAPVRNHSLEYAGRSLANKLGRLRREMALNGADALLVSALDDVAWLTNLRGADVDFNPVFIAYALVEKEAAYLYVDESQVSGDVRSALGDAVLVRPYKDVEQRLADLGKAEAAVWVDPATCSQRLYAELSAKGSRALTKTGPIAAWKAVKNETEIAGMKACHVRDGVAMCRFLRWLGEAVEERGQTELSVAAHLQALRGEGEKYVGGSFNTISGFGPHGAIVHYAASEESDVPLGLGNLLLIDSGGQYEDGTTDITRTVALGVPTDEHRRAYTAVLKGHLQLGRTLFPEGTNGYQLDVLARSPLWNLGLNYGHGTGHGVGAHLCVHEGPFSVSLRKNMTPLEPGHILSNEPGFYKTDGFGIRVENLVLVVSKMKNESGTFFGFENLTMCPYDRNLIDVSMLCPEDRAQIDTYHALVHATLAPLLEGPDAAWLEQATRSLPGE